MTRTTPLISFITVNYNQTKLTLELIESIYQFVDIPYEIIVVDNHSKVSPKAVIEKKYPKVKIIVSGVNRGFAGGNNLGVKVSSGKFLFFINNDAILTKGALQRMLSSFEDPKVGMISPLICYYPASEKKAKKDVIQYAGATNVNAFTGRNTIIGEGEIHLGQYNQSKPTFYAHGAAMLIRRSVLEEVGMMSEFYFLYYEELDWCERIRRAGFTILFEPAAKIYHKESVSVGQTNPLKTYYLTRNRILFMYRNRTKFEFFIFSLFLFFIATPKHILRYVYQRNWKHLTAFLQGVKWNFTDSLERRIIQAISKKNMPSKSFKAVA